MIVIVAVSLLVPLISPRRLGRVWGGLTLLCLLAIDEPVKEQELINELCETMQSQINRLRRGMTFSIALGLTGLALAAVAFAVEKAFYAP
jgi:hypothetical protein